MVAQRTVTEREGRKLEYPAMVVLVLVKIAESNAYSKCKKNEDKKEYTHLH